MTKFLLFIMAAFVCSNILPAQDIIILRNGDEIRAKVEEIGTDYVKYKKYENLTGPGYALKKYEIFMIKYENGDKDAFDAKGRTIKTPSKENGEPQKPQQNITPPAEAEMPKTENSKQTANQKKQENKQEVLKPPQNITPPPAEAEMPKTENSKQTTNQEMPLTEQQAQQQVDTIETPLPQTDYLLSDEYISSVAEQQPVETQAIDYVTEVKALVDLFKLKQEKFIGIIYKWNEQITNILRQIDNTNVALAQTENSLESTKNAKAISSEQEVNTLKNKLNTQRTSLKQLKNTLAGKGSEIAKQLNDMAKQDIGDIDNKFDEVCKQISPSTSFPALSNKTVTVAFTAKIEDLQTVKYLRATNELRFWFYNAENSFREIIEARTQQARDFIEKDSQMYQQQQNFNDSLSEYQKESKTRKKEIKDLKQKISDLEKERKNMAKTMEKAAKTFADYLKNYNKTVQTEYKRRIQNVTEEINYSFRENF
jgi:uncharacterized protein YlxW (UPF0749 family)